MKKKIFSVLLVLLLLASQFSLFSSCDSVNEKQKFSEYYFDYFDTVTTITGYTETEEEFKSICEEIKTELSEYHKLYNIYFRFQGVKNICVINELVDGKHNVVKVDKKIIDLLLYSKEMYSLTDGKINVAMGSVLSVWHKYREIGLSDPSNAELPPVNVLEEAKKHTDFSKVEIDEENNTVFLSDPQMTLDVGAIAKGYAVERIAEYLINKGITDFLLNVGGNVRTIGMGKDNEPWKVGIENPDTSKQEEVPHIEYLKFSNMSLVTSGCYQRFYEVDGKNYHHIIDPVTLYPGEKYLSVSVLTNDSGLGDALSTSLFLMNIEEGKKLADSLENVEVMWVKKNGEQIYTDGFKNYTFEYKK
ncbi:MAG: FAD:protein FMN transferase [Ruminococcaceae bacterium]|nr:FAD:protein FMN transferase [Oscillospiraceae bacterium]